MAIVEQNNTPPAERGLAVLGERWALLIVKEALAGETRFETFPQIFGATPEVLIERLHTLVDCGVMTRDATCEPTGQTRYSYHLTDAGRDLLVIIQGLQQWGDAHVPWSEGTTIIRRSRNTGAPVRVAFVDDDGEEVPAHQVATIPVTEDPRKTL